MDNGTQGYGFMVNGEDMVTGTTPNPQSQPTGEPIPVSYYGDPNNTAVDHKDGFSTPQE